MCSQWQTFWKLILHLLQHLDWQCWKRCPGFVFCGFFVLCFCVCLCISLPRHAAQPPLCRLCRKCRKWELCRLCRLYKLRSSRTSFISSLGLFSFLCTKCVLLHKSDFQVCSHGSAKLKNILPYLQKILSSKGFKKCIIMGLSVRLFIFKMCIQFKESKGLTLNIA